MFEFESNAPVTTMTEMKEVYDPPAGKFHYQSMEDYEKDYKESISNNDEYWAKVLLCGLFKFVIASTLVEAHVSFVTRKCALCATS